MSERPIASQEVHLRQAIDQLFTPELCRVREKSAQRDVRRRDKFLATVVSRTFEPSNIPEEAVEIARGGALPQGLPRLNLHRSQIARVRFGHEVLLFDYVQCDLTEYPPSGSTGGPDIVPFVYRADLLAPIEFDAQFAGIIAVCLQANIDQKS